ncbi:MAG: hydantoinase/oxoprolinase family protein [Alphaproteobacteria bacterium]|jgi:N-methylhydantoinase A|nr:hydantoinase/oxoprolinase family protein [Alphaproteobacteria bacterium]
MATAPESGDRYLIGIDVGGTFTDVLCYAPGTGRLLSAKVPSIPDSQWHGVLDALMALGIELAQIDAFVHGTTIATNALLERKGSKTGLVTTDGFRDALEIGRTRRLVGGLFDIRFQRTPPVVTRDLRLEVPERTAADGEVLADLADFDFAAVAETFQAEGVETLAVCFLNAYVNDANERAAAERLAELLPEVPISQSAAVVRERGEYERFSTAVLNAYLTPTVRRYLATLRGELEGKGITAPVSIMGSNGGAMTLAQAGDFVVGTFLSGPVGGVVGALRVAEAAEIADCITFDMGGTSTDVALVHRLAPRIRHANQLDAFPLQVPQLDIHTIGAGGGSIVKRQDDGTLEVGPESAGAVPGPACYGRGGEAPTISDANLLLGRLTSERSLSGGLRLSAEAAEAAFRRLQGEEDGVDVVALADGAVQLAVTKMAGAVREVSVHRGFDPRAFTLVGFGGAGPMHVLMVAEELAIPRALIPRLPGHLSALGQLLADYRRDSVQAWGGRLADIDVADFRTEASAMREVAARRLSADGIAPDRHRHEFTVDMRYAGQSFTLAVPADGAAEDWSTLRAAFDVRHEETFGFADAANEAEIVNIRLVSIGTTDKPEVGFAPERAGQPLIEQRPVWFGGGFVDCPVYDREGLTDGFAFFGPAIVEEAGGTTVVPPGWHVEVGGSGALDCRLGAAE